MDLIFNLEPWHWMALGIALLAIEILVSTELLLGIGLGALGVALIHKLSPDLSWQMQLVWFGLLSVIFTVVYWKKFRAAKQESDKPLLNQRTQQLVGKTTTLLEPIVNGTGKVQIADALWIVTGPDLEKDTAVKVIDADGMTLIVEPIIKE